MKLLSAILAALACAALFGAGEPFELTGQIMLIADTSPRRLYVIAQDNPDGNYFWDISNAKAKYASGDIVKVQGFLGNPTSAILREISDSFARYATNITVLSTAKFPQTIYASAQEIANLPGKNNYVHAGGTVVSVIRDATNAAWNWLVVLTGTGSVMAAATDHDYPYAELRRLLDAEVTIRGIVQEFHVWRKFLGNHVILYGKDGIEVTKAPGDPFAAPGLDVKTSHRRQVAGTVVGVSSRRLFIRDAANQFISVSPSDLGDDMPAAGESVTVSGFVKNGPLGIQLTEAAVRRDDKPRAALDPAEDVDVERLLAACRDNDIVDASLYGKPVRISGHVANSAEDIALSGRIMLECNRKNISVDVAHLPQNVRDSLETGSLLEICGICIPEFDADVTNMVFPEFKGLIVIPRASEDIRVLRTPPWWTPGRLAVVIIVLVLTLAAILVWNRMLKVLSERRGRALCDEQMSSAISELKVEERTRLAVELHDSLSQTLTGVAMQLEVGATDTAKTMLTACRGDLRRCRGDLRSRTFEEKDMTEAIERTLEPHSVGAKIAVRFNVQRERLDDSTTHTILRIVRELVVNAIRHGKATEIKVAGECHGDAISFSVRDNGCGFNTANAPGLQEGHFGLLGIHERLKEFSGNLKIESSPGQGTKATISMAIGQETSKPTPT